MPYSMVSRSRISPIRITSGAWRKVFFSAKCQLSQSTPTSRCVTTQPLWACTYSTGSSMVMMWPRVFSLRYPTMAARGGFTRARAADQQHETALGKHHFLQDGRQLELLERRDLGIDRAQDRAG